MGRLQCCAAVVVLFLTVPSCFSTPSMTSVVSFQCRYTNSSEEQYGNGIQWAYNRNITVTLACERDFSQLVPVFENETTNMFLGALELSYEMKIRSLASSYNRHYISPFSVFPYHNKDRMFSLGPSFSQSAYAFTTVLTHFQWKGVLLLTESSQFFSQMSTSLYVTLSEAGFEPEMTYLSRGSDGMYIRSVLKTLTSNLKAIVLCVNEKFRSAILRQAALENMQQRHAFFILEHNAYSTMDSYNFEDLDDELTQVLESVLIMYPVFQTSHEIQKRSTGDFPFHNKVKDGGTIATAMTGRRKSSRRNKRDSRADQTSAEAFLGDAINVIEYLSEFSSNRDQDGSNLNQFTGLQNGTLSMSHGDVTIDVNNEIVFDFVLYDFDTDNMEVVTVKKIVQLEDRTWELQSIANILWPDGIPLNPDSCFYPESCQSETGMDALYILSISLAVLFVVGVITAIVIAVWMQPVALESSA